MHDINRGHYLFHHLYYLDFGVVYYAIDRVYYHVSVQQALER
jgi:hypothetical protein